MNVKRIVTPCGSLLLLGVALAAFAGIQDHAGGQMKHREMTRPQMMMHSTGDERVSLGLSPQMKDHQLATMRSHVEAIQSIVGLLADGNFDAASHVAHSKLGLTDEMNEMCSMFENEDFRTLGMRFHKSADALSETLKTKDMKESLRALRTTMGYCVQCHATFRQ